MVQTTGRYWSKALLIHSAAVEYARERKVTVKSESTYFIDLNMPFHSSTVMKFRKCDSQCSRNKITEVSLGNSAMAVHNVVTSAELFALSGPH